MGKIVQYLTVMIILFSVSSCIKDEPSECPPEYTIRVSIKDKNFFNIAQVTQLQPLDENLPLSNYISNLYYSLRDLSTGNIYMESQFIPLSGTDKYYTIAFKNIPHGKYVLDVWGNLDSNGNVGFLHANNNESTDLYLGSTELNFTSDFQEGNVELERVKGKLLVLCTNFPSTITSIMQQINNLYETVGSQKVYSGNTFVTKTSPSATQIETSLSPSIDQMNSILKLTFTSSANAVVKDIANGNLQVPDINLSIKRNEISVVSVNYNDLIGEWEVSALIDNQWTLIHQFKISDL